MEGRSSRNRRPAAFLLLAEVRVRSWQRRPFIHNHNQQQAVVDS